MTKYMKRMRRRMMEAAYEGHMRGRIYNANGEKRTPTEEHDALAAWVDRQLKIKRGR